MLSAMSKLGLTRDKIYKTVARQLHGNVPCWMCGEHVSPADATLEHIQPLSEGGSSHIENLAISHGRCNNQRHAKAALLPAGGTEPLSSPSHGTAPLN
jgi:5-methylcytosine-specific restriction endonuclease McrA